MPETAPCLHDLSPGALKTRLGAIHDPEDARLPPDLPPVVDAHVHLFPDRLFAAIWRWFDEYGWPIRYKLHAQEVIQFQRDRGVKQIIALHYAHTPGIARDLNRFMSDLVRQNPDVTGVATVMPGEPDARAILEEGFSLGLSGVKLHCHVQCVGPDHPSMAEIYQTCADHGKPLVIHAGREPKSPAYKCDPHAICSVGRVEDVLKDFPKLKLVVPHLGVDEFEGYLDLVTRYDNLWLDTTMVLADYFDCAVPAELLTRRPERVMYGTDFPNIPYAWDREIKFLRSKTLTADALERIAGKTATALFTNE